MFLFYKNLAPKAGMRSPVINQTGRVFGSMPSTGFIGSAMPRPRKLPDATRSETLALRLTPAERLQVDEVAAAAGLSVSAYARDQVLGGKVVVRESRRLDPALFDELRRVGVNLNQLTRLAHIKGGMPHELSDVCATLDRVLQAVLADGLASALNGADESDGHASVSGQAPPPAPKPVQKPGIWARLRMGPERS